MGMRCWDGDERYLLQNGGQTRRVARDNRKRVRFRIVEGWFAR